MVRFPAPALQPLSCAALRVSMLREIGLHSAVRNAHAHCTMEPDCPRPLRSAFDSCAGLRQAQEQGRHGAAQEDQGRRGRADAGDHLVVAADADAVGRGEVARKRRRVRVRAQMRRLLPRRMTSDSCCRT